MFPGCKKFEATWENGRLLVIRDDPLCALFSDGQQAASFIRLKRAINYTPANCTNKKLIWNEQSHKYFRKRS
jgi:hypothetical protein